MKIISQANRKLAVLAYGSLISDPGDELKQITAGIENTLTPFDVEYGRLSRGRGHAPTLIPVEDGQGARVKAKLLLIQDGVSLQALKTIIWRRETRSSDRIMQYHEPDSANQNAVRIKVLDDFQGITATVYTSIPSNISGEITPNFLAQQAICSILNEAGDRQCDGIRYLKDCKNHGIVKRLSEAYEGEILKQTKTTSLDEAIVVMGKRRGF